MAVSDPARHRGGAAIPFWRDLRFWQVFLQVAFLIILVLVVIDLGNNIISSLREINQTPNFEFLGNKAGFEIGGAENYSPDDSFFEAFLVGVRNTLSVVTVGLVSTTVIGIFFGIFLLSNNWLVRTLARIYVEILRNTPVLVQILIWYFVVFVALPRPQDAVEFPGGGAFNITWRWIVYLVVGLFITFYFRERSPNIRSGVITGAASAAVVMELGFWRAIQLQINGTESAVATADLLRSGSLSYIPFWIYLVISVALIAAVYFLVKKANIKAILSGLTGGQLFGGLLFYFGIIPGGSAVQLEGALVSMSARGVFLPEFVTTPRYPMWIAFLTLGVIIAVAQWMYLGQITETTGRQFPRFWYGAGAIIVLGLVGWFAVQIGAPPVTTAYLGEDTVATIDEDGNVTLVIDEEVTVIKDRKGIRIEVPTDDVPTENQPLTVYEALRGRYVTPRQISALDHNAFSIFPAVRDENGRRYVAGEGLSPEYMAVLVGLVIYTSAFIAEIVRAGIQAVPKGQSEAANAVGLSSNDTLSLIILPQALRVIIPPMGNQYLNLAKNSSLAIVASYSDVFQVMNTIINQSGQSVSGIVIIMIFYLIMSLVISFVMNTVNQRFQLVTR
jgi:His/Glu/Gln/Arg/opine family amino acid ABC transporter permease subunit